MDVLLQIPVLGYILQFLGYLVNAVFTTNLPAQTLQLATPIALGALCGVMNERSGVVNIGIEGMMLTARIRRIHGRRWSSATRCRMPCRVFSASRRRSSWASWRPSGHGMLVSLLHAWLCITVRADQIISGTIDQHHRARR